MNISPWLGAAPAKPNPPTANIRDVSGTDFTAAHYVRFTVADRPGIIASLATLLSAHGINIDAVLQLPGHDKAELPFVMTLEACPVSVLDAAHSVGLSGGGRLHDLTVTLEAMTPGEIRARGAGVIFHHGVADTPFGTAFIAETQRGLCRLAFIEEAGQSELRALRDSWPEARFVRDDARAKTLVETIWGQRVARLPLAVCGTNFQVQVWRALLELDTGETVTYSALARKLGLPKGARAVGNAVGANPIAWVIPCHRVLRAGGKLGGYRWGTARKQMIRRWEERRTGIS